MSPRDWKGHGTHVSSILAGNVVKNVDMFGLINGTAKGGAPMARIAMYKVRKNGLISTQFDAKNCEGKLCNTATTLGV